MADIKEVIVEKGSDVVVNIIYVVIGVAAFIAIVGGTLIGLIGMI